VASRVACPSSLYCSLPVDCCLRPERRM
jgi:hypothetical protein